MATNSQQSLRELAESEGFAEPATSYVRESGISPIASSPLTVQGNGVKRSATVGKLVEALCKAQLEFAPVVKANINPQFKSKYADLATIIQATMPALAKHGLAIVQTPYVNGRELTMTTMLIHSSDEWISNDLTMPATMRNELTAQTIGSACTYSRRYALQSILGIAADVDDDGMVASGGGTHEAAQAVAQAKIAEAKAKRGEKSAPEASNGSASLFYALQPSGLYAIDGDDQLKRACWKTLKPFWSENAKSFMVTDNQLEDLKYQFETAHISFAPLKGPKT